MQGPAWGKAFLAVLLLGLVVGAPWAWQRLQRNGDPGTPSHPDAGDPVMDPEPDAVPGEGRASPEGPSLPGDSTGADPASGAAPGPAADPFLRIRRALVALEVRDANGVRLRDAAALPLDSPGALLIPLEHLNGAAELYDPGSGTVLRQVRWWEPGGLCVVAGGPPLTRDPSEDGTVLRAAADDVVVGEELFALITDLRSVESRSRAGFVAGKEDPGRILVRAAPSLAQRFVFLGNGELVGVGAGPVNGSGQVLTVDRLPTDPAAASASNLAVLAQYFDRRAESRRERAVLYAAGRHWRSAVEQYLAALSLDPRQRDHCEEGILSCLRLMLAEGLAEDSHVDGAGYFRRAAEVLYDSSEAWELLAVMASRESAHLVAVDALQKAIRHVQGDPTTLERMLGTSYLRAAERARANGQLADARDLLEESLARLPAQAAEDLLRLKALGYVLYESGDDVGAYEVLREVAALDTGQGSALSPLLARLEDELSRPVAAFIQFDPKAGAILSEATFNGRKDLSVLVDTGASLTALSQNAAQALGLWPTQGVRQVEVITAGGRVVAPVVVLESINLQGAQRHKVEAVVLDLDSGAAADALIGLNFLQAYDVAIDSQRGVMKLRPRR